MENYWGFSILERKCISRKISLRMKPEIVRMSCSIGNRIRTWSLSSDSDPAHLTVKLFHWKGENRIVILKLRFPRNSEKKRCTCNRKLCEWVVPLEIESEREFWVRIRIQHIRKCRFPIRKVKLMALCTCLRLTWAQMGAKHSPELNLYQNLTRFRNLFCWISKILFFG